LLLTGQLGSLAENQKDVLARMEHSSRKLSRMASAMFQLSVGRHIDQKPNLERGDIRECIEQALHEIAPFSQEKRIDIGVEVDDPSDFLRFERSQIEQVLMNLLDNACKFTPRMGTITIRGFPFFWERRAASLIEYVAERRAQELRTPNSFRIDICDSGPGIPPAHLSRIFEEYTFYAGPHDRSGGGLGLAICKMILHNHHGRVWAQSSSAGAIFSFVLPFHRPETPHESAVRAFDNFQYVHHR